MASDMAKSTLMIAFKKIITSPDLTFDVMVCGAEDTPLVLLLHGFAAVSYTHLTLPTKA